MRGVGGIEKKEKYGVPWQRWGARGKEKKQKNYKKGEVKLRRG